MSSRCCTLICSCKGIRAARFLAKIAFVFREMFNSTLTLML